MSEEDWSRSGYHRKARFLHSELFSVRDEAIDGRIVNISSLAVWIGQAGHVTFGPASRSIGLYKRSHRNFRPPCTVNDDRPRIHRDRL